MGRFLVKRVLLGFITLILLSVIVFLAAQVLPGNVARNILGPFADQGAVDALNEQLGANDPLLVQYGSWLGGFLTGDFGDSVAFQRPVGEILGPAISNSALLAVLAFVIVVPLGIVGGVVAALGEGTLRDKFISVGGVTATTVPEFVWAVIFILVFALGLGLLPTTATAPQGSGLFTELRYLLLPAICLVFVLFGYIARMARAGTIEALDADYTRTATLKGLKRSQVLRRHVIRNGLLPTIAVIATNIGYLFGGIVAIEKLFGYPGVGALTLQAASVKNFPMLQACVLVIGIVYFAATLTGDLLIAALNPRIRLARQA